MSLFIWNYFHNFLLNYSYVYDTCQILILAWQKSKNKKLGPSCNLHPNKIRGFLYLEMVSWADDKNHSRLSKEAWKAEMTSPVWGIAIVRCGFSHIEACAEANCAEAKEPGWISLIYECLQTFPSHWPLRGLCHHTIFCPVSEIL